MAKSQAGNTAFAYMRSFRISLSDTNQEGDEAMTEYEYMDLAFTLVERSENAGLAFLTVVSGYLIVAYLIGEKLTKGQVILVSALFFCYAFAQVLAQISQINAIVNIYQIMNESFPDSSTYRPSSLAKMGYIWPLLEFLAILASLNFMWSVRHSKKVRPF